MHRAVLGTWLVVGLMGGGFAARTVAELDEIDLLLREARSEDESPAPQFAPGVETRVRGKNFGEDGYYTLFLPKDYTPHHPWPVLFCYHSMNEKPNTSPFREVLEGRHFLLVGVGYHQGGREGYDYIRTEDVALLKRVLRSVNRHVRMDRERLFVGGFSRGAFYAASMLNHVPEIPWAGGVLLGGGMSEPTAPKRPRSLYKVPIFIGCGEKDPHLSYAQIAADHFQAMNSLVTRELWPRTGHVSQYPGSKLRDWLIQNGPLRDASTRLARAKVEEKAGRCGRALSLYESLAHVDDGNPLCQQADVAARALAARGEEMLTRAREALEKKDYSLAEDLLSELAEAFRESRFGEQAETLAKQLQNDPAVRERISRQRTDEEAKELERRAQTAEKNGRFSEAVRLYEMYLWQYPLAEGAERVKKRLEAIHSDDNLQKRVRDQQAARECRAWLNMADAYLDQGKPEKAKPLLENILRKYPDTTWAVKARVRLRNME